MKSRGVNGTSESFLGHSRAIYTRWGENFNVLFGRTEGKRFINQTCNIVNMVKADLIGQMEKYKDKPPIRLKPRLKIPDRENLR